MKKIKYKFLSCEINRGTEEQPNIEQVFLEKEIQCATESVLEANLPIAEKEAVPGTIEVIGEFDPKPTTEADRIAELEEALALLLSGSVE